jgi:hypothetical protein
MTYILNLKQGACLIAAVVLCPGASNSQAQTAAQPPRLSGS